MKLNREQIIKALKYCFNDKPCSECEWHEIGNGCVGSLEQSAISLINELTEENERLIDSIKLYHKYNTAIKQTKADTVRKMQERLKENFRKYNKSNWSVRAIIDEAAKEMLEDDK